MKKYILLSIIFISANLFAQDDFITALSLRFHRDSGELAKLNYRGYGRLELIKLILISDASKTALKNLIKKRDKHVTLAAIAKERGVEFETIFLESEKIKSEIDFTIALGTTSAITPDQPR